MYRERISALLNKVKQQNDDPELQDSMFGIVERGLYSFIRYVDCVYNMETMISIARFRANDAQEFQQKVQDLDSSRRYAHDAAISSINVIDRLCDRLNVAPVYGGSQDRKDIGDFCGAIVGEYFENRSLGRTMVQNEIKQTLCKEATFDEEIDIDEEMEFER